MLGLQQWGASKGGGDLELSFNHSVPIVVCAPSQTQGKEAFKETDGMAHGNSASEFSSLLMKCFLKIFFFTVLFICMGSVHSACENQRTTYKTELSPTIWVPGIELALSDLAASPFPR